MSITIIRKVDDLGRVVIPKDARRQLGIEDGDEIEIEVRGGEVVLKKHEPTMPVATQAYLLINAAVHDGATHPQVIEARNLLRDAMGGEAS